MFYTLVIWTVVGFAGTQISTHKAYGWRPITDVATIEHCHKAAADLGITDKREYRCLKKTGTL